MDVFIIIVIGLICFCIYKSDPIQCALANAKAREDIEAAEKEKAKAGELAKKERQNLWEQCETFAQTLVTKDVIKKLADELFLHIRDNIAGSVEHSTQNKEACHLVIATNTYSVFSERTYKFKYTTGGGEYKEYTSDFWFKSFLIYLLSYGIQNLDCEKDKYKVYGLSMALYELVAARVFQLNIPEIQNLDIRIDPDEWNLIHLNFTIEQDKYIEL